MIGIWLTLSTEPMKGQERSSQPWTIEDAHLRIGGDGLAQLRDGALAQRIVALPELVYVVGERVVARVNLPAHGMGEEVDHGGGDRCDDGGKSGSLARCSGA